MKKALFSILFLLGISVSAMACEIKINVLGEQKSIFKQGDEITVKVTVVYIHRICELELTDTNFLADGLKIISAGEWTEVDPVTFTRELKIKVLADGKKTGVLNVERNCNKDGGFGSLKINKE